MYPNFENLAEEKKQIIINASLEEFAQKGYEKASTNIIIKNAGISKGILFHYFGNKKNLFLYLVDYSIEVLAENFVICITDRDDFFERLMRISLKKLELANRYPLVNKMVLAAFADMPPDLAEELGKRYEKLRTKYMPDLISKVDTDKFRKGINKEKALETVLIALEAIGSRYNEKYKGRTGDMLKDLDSIMEDYKEYIDILKLGVYEK